jgi:hypothetical protein
MRKDEIQVVGVANIADIAYSIGCEKKAMAMILEIDQAQQEAGFTENLIVTLVNSMKKEYKGDHEAMAEFSRTIQRALK